MATAAVDLKDHVTCPVCLEVFDDPRILKCLHSVCARCLTNLQNFNTVVCPVCRDKCPHGQIKADFKTQALLELYGTPQKDKNDKKPTSVATGKSEMDSGQHFQICAICKKNEIVSYCCQCKVLICQLCMTSHNRIPSCKDHTFGLELYRRDQAEKLLKAVNSLEKTGIGKPDEQLQFDSKVQELEMQAVQDIKDAEQQAIAEVKKHHQNLIGMVQLQKFKILGTRAQQKEELRVQALHLQDEVAQYAKQMVQSEGGSVSLHGITQDSQRIALYESQIDALKKTYSTGRCALKTVIDVRKVEYNTAIGTKIAFRERSRCSIQ